MDPTKLSKNKMLLTGIGEAQVTTIGSFELHWCFTLHKQSALEKLKQQQKTFGNPIRIISDRGSAFTSKLFNDYCDEENIQHLQIETGVPRGNGQVERIQRTLIPVLTKLSLDDSTKWYKYVDRLQRILNSTISRSTKWTPFKLLVGIKMRNKEDILIKDLLLEEMAKELLEQREFLRNDAKKNIETLQSENRKTYNRRRKKVSLYKEGDIVAIQRTQFGAGLKLRPKFLGPYKVTKVNSKDRYEVEKRPTNHCLFNTSRLFRISAPCAAPPGLTSNNEKGSFPRLLKCVPARISSQSSCHCWRSPLPHASSLIQRDFGCVLGLQQTKQLPHVAKVDLIRRASRSEKQFNLVIDEEPLDNACHVWSRIFLLKYGCGQALKVRKDNWLQHLGDVAVAVLSIGNAY
ncbi:transposon Tf2-6 polyprotein [Trichonephila clavipes]|nr:transposon Tf2-6 polyprotein [Trichonephila clavipes]